MYDQHANFAPGPKAPGPISHPQALSSLKSMRDLAVHLCWLGSHCARSFLESSHTQQLYETLAVEVRELQAELHRAHRLIEGYNSLLSRDDSKIRLQLLGTQVFTVILLGLTACLWYLWVLRRPRIVQGPGILPLGDTRGSSSDSDLPEPKPFEARSAGPVRPSSLGKGKRKA